MKSVTPRPPRIQYRSSPQRMREAQNSKQTLDPMYPARKFIPFRPMRNRQNSPAGSPNMQQMINQGPSYDRQSRIKKSVGALDKTFHVLNMSKDNVLITDQIRERQIQSAEHSPSVRYGTPQKHISSIAKTSKASGLPGFPGIDRKGEIRVAQKRHTPSPSLKLDFVLKPINEPLTPNPARMLMKQNLTVDQKAQLCGETPSRKSGKLLKSIDIVKKTLAELGRDDTLTPKPTRNISRDRNLRCQQEYTPTRTRREHPATQANLRGNISFG